MNRRPLETVFEDATVLFADAATLMGRARGLRQELEAARTSGVEETERLVHGATMAGIEAGLVQGLEAALKELRTARERMGVGGPAWLRTLLDPLGSRGT